jgi:hypothetical protein
MTLLLAAVMDVAGAPFYVLARELETISGVRHILT